jgi:hypothetical protein
MVRGEGEGGGFRDDMLRFVVVGCGRLGEICNKSLRV